jgi:hypothetical protein
VQCLRQNNHPAGLRLYGDPEGLACEACSSTSLRRIVSRRITTGALPTGLSSYEPGPGVGRLFKGHTRNFGLHAERIAQKGRRGAERWFKAKLEKIRTDPSSVIKDDT